jgi:hypothetical protein
MAGLARQIAVLAEQLEPGRQVIELRALGGCCVRGQNERACEQQGRQQAATRCAGHAGRGAQR